MKSTPSGEQPARVVDAKPYIQHHPIVGYQYTPGITQTLPAPDGGDYTITINSAGIRSDREYSPRKPPGVRRILVFGDSYAAGQFVSNRLRFSEILERRVPNLEVINFGLEGTGTDQQLLIFEHLARGYEFDAVVVLPFLQNIRRNLAESRPSVDAKTGKEILRPKPRFELVNGKLELRNVPVPSEGITLENADEKTRAKSDMGLSFAARVKGAVSRVPGANAAKRVAYSVLPWEPFPEYRNANHPAWRLMSAILLRFKELAGEKPLVIVPVVYSNYVRFRMARNYMKRFAELARQPGIHAVDALPYFKSGDGAMSNWFDRDVHFSIQGHAVLADALQRELTKLGLL